MDKSTAVLLVWSPRIAGTLVSLFIGMFALDAFNEGKPFLQALPDFMIHLIPAFALLAIVGASFRWPWLGAISFIGLGASSSGRFARDADRLLAEGFGRD